LLTQLDLVDPPNEALVEFFALDESDVPEILESPADFSVIDH
jgi:hypothetical protein